MGFLHDIGVWLWRLVPANPILVRVVLTGSKRTNHLWARVLYLGALVVVFLLGRGVLMGVEGRSLAELAKQSTQTFMAVSIIQLLLMCFAAPIFCAGAITQEKDANTFHILLTTPLSNAQIVLGSLLSRLYFVWALLLSGLPIFCITMLYGGVTTKEIFESFGLTATTALVTGSIALLISVTRVGTRRTLFTFFAGIAVYLLGVGQIGLSGVAAVPEAAPGLTFLSSVTTYQMSWLAPLHPFLALLVITGQTPAPTPSAVLHYGWPLRWFLAYPQYGYMLLTTLTSLVLVGVALLSVRRGGLREGESGAVARGMEAFRKRLTGERRKRPRRVWTNPIAWREAATRASAGGRSVLRSAYMILGMLGALALPAAYLAGWFGTGPGAADTLREWLVPIVWIEMVVALLVVTSTAATTLTREKESLTIELLLCTPLTSYYIVAGMLQGLVRLVVPLIAVPVLTVAALVVIEALSKPGTGPLTAPESILLLPVLLIAFCSVAAVVGLHFSLNLKKTVPAVIVSTAIVLGGAGLLTMCGLAVQGVSFDLMGILLPFTPTWGVQSLVDPWGMLDQAANQSTSGAMSVNADQVASFRGVRAVVSVLASVAYLALTYALYNSIVRSFDMTLRRQSA